MFGLFGGKSFDEKFKSAMSAATKKFWDGDQYYSMPPLGYEYDALEPYISADTMKVHRELEHRVHVDMSNRHLRKCSVELRRLPVESLIQRLKDVPAEVREGLRNFGGGHANHCFFWRCLKKNTKLEGSLKEAIDRQFGSFEKFQGEFEQAAASRFGSGWAWLVMKPDRSLAVCSTANQDSPLMGEAIAGCSGFPIVGLDVWEHAYLMDYLNARDHYVKGWWKVVNWEFAAERYQAGLGLAQGGDGGSGGSASGSSGH